MSRKSSTEYVHNQEDADIEVFESEYRTYRESEAAENRDGLHNGDEENWKVNSSKQKFGVTKNELSDVLYDSIPAYEESTVTLKEYYDHSIKNNLTAKSAGSYLVSLFPIIKWFPHYNFTWGYADLVAGITVGCVLVPQSMSYAQIASLSPEYGLYSSFIGAFIYSLFATSKDVCIGPVAVMSLQTAKVIAEVLKKISRRPDRSYSSYHCNYPLFALWDCRHWVGYTAFRLFSGTYFSKCCCWLHDRFRI